jgi:protein TonB
VSERVSEPENSRRTPLTLLAFLAASVAVHAAIIVVLPEFPLDRAPAAPPLTVLEVVLVQTAPPRPIPLAEARPGPAPSLAPPVRHKTGKPQTVSTAIPEPRAVDAAPPLLTLPEPAPDAKVAAASAERPEAIAGADTIPPPKVAIVAPTPPQFSASYLQNPAPRYPLAARRAGEQGTVTLKVLVSSEGLPQHVAIEKTSGSSRLDAAALDAVRRWRFVPARRGVTPIKSWVLVPVVFRLEEPS